MCPGIFLMALLRVHNHNPNPHLTGTEHTTSVCGPITVACGSWSNMEIILSRFCQMEKMNIIQYFATTYMTVVCIDE